MKRIDLKMPTHSVPFRPTSEWKRSQSYINGYWAAFRIGVRAPSTNEYDKDAWKMGYDDAVGNLELCDDDV